MSILIISRLTNKNTLNYLDIRKIMVIFAATKRKAMTTSIIILIGLALIAKHQFEILRYRYKRAEICPEKLFPTGTQSYHLTKLAENYPQRPIVFIPLLLCWVKRPLLSEILGTLLILGSVCWAFEYADNFPLIFSVALGGVSWIFVTKLALTTMLKLCDHPTAKLVVMAIVVYPILLGSLHIMDYLIFSNDLYTLIKEIRL